MNLINNGQMDRGNEKANPEFALMIEENHEKTCQDGRHRDLIPGLPECESRALPRSHIARCFLYWKNYMQENFF